MNAPRSAGTGCLRQVEDGTICSVTLHSRPYFHVEGVMAESMGNRTDPLVLRRYRLQLQRELDELDRLLDGRREPHDTGHSERAADASQTSTDPLLLRSLAVL